METTPPPTIEAELQAARAIIEIRNKELDELDRNRREQPTKQPRRNQIQPAPADPDGRQ